MKILELPTTRTETAHRGTTYFYANRTCPIHNTRMHWSHSGQCMACYDYNGLKLTPSKQLRVKSSEQGRAP
jgi:hypothetical protein